MKKAALLAIVLLLCLGGSTQNIKSFNVPAGNLMQASAARLLTNGYIVTGKYTDGMATTSYLTRYRNNGTLCWTKAETGGVLSGIMDIAENQDQELYLLAEDMGGDQYYTLMKTDSMGNMIWSVNLNKNGLSSYDAPKVKTQGSNVYVMSSTTEKTHLYKLNDNGSLLWSKTLEIDTVQTKNPAFDMAVLPDGGVLYSGKSGNDIFLERFSASGVSLWTKRLFDNDLTYSHPKTITQLQDGNYLIAGFRGQYTAPFHAGLFLLKLDTLGTVLDFNFYADTTGYNAFIPYAVQETPDNKIRVMGCGGALMFAGFDQNLGLESYTRWTSIENVQVNAGCFDYRNDQLIVTGIENESTQYVLRNILGYEDFCNLEELNTIITESLPINNALYTTTANITEGPKTGVVTVVLGDINGFTTAVHCGKPEMLMGTAEEEKAIDLKVYPNPAEGGQYINVNHNFNGMLTYTLVNAAGQLVSQQNGSGFHQQIQLGVQPGLYFLNVGTTGQHLSTTRVVVY